MPILASFSRILCSDKSKLRCIFDSFIIIRFCMKQTFFVNFNNLFVYRWHKYKHICHITKNDFLNKISSFQYSKSLFRMFVNVSIVSCKIRALKENKPTYDVHWQIVSLFWRIIICFPGLSMVHNYVSMSSSSMRYSNYAGVLKTKYSIIKKSRIHWWIWINIMGRQKFCPF